MAGLLALLTGKPKPADDVGDEPMASAEDAYIDEAFSAIKDGDADGFRDAFKAAVRACVRKAKAGSYSPDEDDADEL